MTLEQATQRLSDPDLAPGELSQIRTYLAHEYSRIRAALDQIVIMKPKVWMDLRSVSKSAQEANMLWDQTTEGKQLIYLRGQLESINKMSSAIKTRLEVLSGEARNLY